MEKMGPTGSVTEAVSSAQDRLLDVLTRVTEPVTLAELSEASGLHENTLRAHLDALRFRGRVSRVKRSPQGRGRPAWTYLANPSPHAALAEALAAGLESDAGTPRAAAALGGRDWGKRLVTSLGLADSTDEERVLAALRHVGFQPEPAGDGQVRLTHCPFLDTARAHPDAVCSVHRGMIEGVLSGPDPSRARTVELTPFASPGACLVQLH